MLVLAVGFALSPASAEPTAKSPKFAVILQAGTESHEGLARALHALLYSKELVEAGYEVVLIFDGAGTTWAKESENPQHKLHGVYLGLKKLGITQEICDYCAGAFKVKADLIDRQVALLRNSYGGHPSIAKWVKQGYNLLVL